MRHIIGIMPAIGMFMPMPIIGICAAIGIFIATFMAHLLVDWVIGGRLAAASSARNPVYASATEMQTNVFQGNCPQSRRFVRCLGRMTPGNGRLHRRSRPRLASADRVPDCA